MASVKHDNYVQEGCSKYSIGTQECDQDIPIGVVGTANGFSFCQIEKKDTKLIIFPHTKSDKSMNLPLVMVSTADGFSFLQEK